MSNKDENPIEKSQDINESFKNDKIPKEIQEMIESLPESEQNKAKKAISMSFSATRMMGMGSSSPFEDVMTPEHLTAIISNSDKESQREYEDKKEDRRINFAWNVIGLIFLAVLIIILKSNPELLKSVLTFIVGAGGGYGFGYIKCKSSQKD